MILVALVTRILRPDRLNDCILLLKEEVGAELLVSAENNIVAALDAVKNPKDEFVVCITTPGYDITDQITYVARNLKNLKLNIVSLGKMQNREQASRKISEAQKKGEMVVLFNGHLDVE